jgi:hypothetical protein
MTGHPNFNSRVRTTLRSCSRVLTVVLALAFVIAATASVDAASVSLTWNAPTTSADGTPLTDLMSYKVYLATSVPPCPSSSFLTVSSPTTTPPAGQTVASRVTALTASATYFVRVTAVDNGGNESTCSPSASGVAQVDFSVTPTATTDFGNVTTGGLADRAFTVQNTSTASISGTASVGSPYSVVAGGSFTLAAGASQVVTIRFQPTVAGTNAGNVNFTAGGDSVSRGVSGTGTSVSMIGLSVTKGGTGAGTVTSAPTGISCGASCTASVPVGTLMTLTATAASGSTFAGWGSACSGTTASCAWTMNVDSTVTATFNSTRVKPPVPVASSLSPVTAVKGSPAITLTANGGGFVTSSVVRWNGSARTTTVVSATQLRAALTAADLASVRSVLVTVFTPAPGGGTSAALSFTVTAAPLVPVANSLSPTSVTAGSAGLTLTVNGSDFVASSEVRWNGSARPTTFVSASQLRATLSATDLVTVGSVPVSVFTPAPGGGTSGTVSLAIGAPPVPEVAPASPGNATVTALGTDASGATFAVAWGAAVGATSYRYAAAFNDGTAAQQGTVTGLLSFQLQMPYHASGTAFGGFVCIRSVSATGLQSADQSCSAVSVPARPPTPPPAAPANPTVTQLTADADGVTFEVAWGAASGATSYLYATAFNDGSASQQGTVTGTVVQVRTPYYASGAAFGWFVCIRSVDAAGQQSTDQSCSGTLVPAR